MHDYNLIDKILLAVFLFSGLMGVFRGGVREVFSLLSWVAGFVVATLFSHPLAAYFSHTSTAQSILSSVSSQLETNTAQSVTMFTLGAAFCVLFFGTVLIGTLVGRAANAAVEGAGVSIFNRFIGGIFGLGRAFLVVLVFMFIVQLTDFANDELWTSSRLVQLYQPTVKWFAGLVQPHIDSMREKMKSGMDSLTNTHSGEEDGGQHSESTGLPL